MPWPTKKTFNDGDKLFLEKDKVVKVQLLEDEPTLYYTHYVNGKTNKCSAPDCAFCSAGEKRNEKGNIRVKDLSDGKEKSLSGTSALFLALKETLDMCGGRKAFIFAMKSTGEKQQRRYHITPLPITGATAAGPTTTEEAVPF